MRDEERGKKSTEDWVALSLFRSLWANREFKADSMWSLTVL